MSKDCAIEKGKVFIDITRLSFNDFDFDLMKDNKTVSIRYQTVIDGEKVIKIEHHCLDSIKEKLKNIIKNTNKISKIDI